MRRAGALPLLAPVLGIALLVAGCLEERGAAPTPSTAAGGAGTPPGLGLPPLQFPPPPPEGRLQQVFVATYALEKGVPGPFEVPEGALDLLVAIRWNGSWQGEVALEAPDGAVAASCALVACELTVRDPAPGPWRVLLPMGAGAEVEVTAWVSLPPHLVSPKPIPTPAPTPATPTGPTTPPAPTQPSPGELEPQHALRRDVEFDGRLNQSDFVTVLPSHRLMRVWLGVQVEEAGASAPQVTLGEPTPQGHHEFSRSCADSCFFDVEDPAPGSWWIIMGGEGRGLAVANVTLFEDRAARPTEAITAYRHQHAYDSHAMRGEFEEGFSLPPGFARLAFEARALGEASDPDATPRVQLVGPGNLVAASCDLAAEPSCSLVVQAPEAGAWQVRWLGADAARSAEVVVTAEPMP